MLKSDSLKSYIRFQPILPNFFRSWITAWKKERHYTSGLNSWFVHDSNSLGFILDHELLRFASSPSGGSTTILLLLCSIPSGNVSVGFVVNHKRKSLWDFLNGSLSSNLSSVGNHFLSKWQFWRNTQDPFTIAVLSASSAFSSDPCPSDSSNRLMSNSSFLLTISARGSAPGDRI